MLGNIAIHMLAIMLTTNFKMVTTPIIRKFAQNKQLVSFGFAIVECMISGLTFFSVTIT